MVLTKVELLRIIPISGVHTHDTHSVSSHNLYREKSRLELYKIASSEVGAKL